MPNSLVEQFFWHNEPELTSDNASVWFALAPEHIQPRHCRSGQRSNHSCACALRQPTGWSWLWATKRRSWSLSHCATGSKGCEASHGIQDQLSQGIVFGGAISFSMLFYTSQDTLDPSILNSITGILTVAHMDPMGYVQLFTLIIGGHRRTKSAWSLFSM